MAGSSSSEEMDAFDDVTPAKRVSIYDLDEEMPTRAQSSEEIAEFQEKAKQKREAAFRSFRPPTDSRPGDRTSSPSIPPGSIPPGSGRTSSPSDPGSGSMPRPVPRESGPVRIDRSPPAEADVDLADALNDVAATLERLPPAPRVPKIEQPRGSLEFIPGFTTIPPTPLQSHPRRWRIALTITICLALIAAAAIAFFR